VYRALPGHRPDLSESQQVVLDKAAVFRLILADDTEIRIQQPFGAVNRSASPEIRRTFFPDDIHGNFKPHATVNTALTAMVMLFIGIEYDDFVAEKPGCLCAGLGSGRRKNKVY
jgi:hypothetical protein